MSAKERTKRSSGVAWLLRAACLAAALLLAASPAYAAIDGIQGPNFLLNASADYITMPDGASIYSWGYGDLTGSDGGLTGMQLPGPTLVVTQGQTVTVKLTNNLPAIAGNVSIVFPGFDVTAAGGVSGLLAREALPGANVTYTFVASKPGTYLYYSGTRPEVQVEMGLYGALIVRPAGAQYAKCAYQHADSCYDREYLFLLSEVDIELHQAVEMQTYGVNPGPLPLEPYWPEYYLINGRAAMDTLSSAKSPLLAHQPYNILPLMQPGEKLLQRILGAGRMLHPFHIHGNHVKVLARDGNLIPSPTDTTKIAGPIIFTHPVLPGGTVDAIFTWTGKDLNWDVYGHTAADGIACNDINGDGFDDDDIGGNKGEYCPDHLKPIPVALPDPQVVTNGALYPGSPYLGHLGTLPPGEGGLNPFGGFAYMWHSHTEKELINNNIFPGGLLTMMLVVPPGTLLPE